MSTKKNLHTPKPLRNFVCIKTGVLSVTTKDMLSLKPNMFIEIFVNRTANHEQKSENYEGLLQNRNSQLLYPERLNLNDSEYVHGIN